MQWLFENPLANMPGPAFLGLFGALLVGAIIILRIKAAKIEQGEFAPPLPIPDQIDPYKIAYLRGGDTEVIRTAMLDLVEQGRIVDVQKKGLGKILSQAKMQWKVADPTDTGADLPPIQRAILRAFAIPRDPETLFQSDIKSRVHEETRPYRDWVDQEKLEADPEGRLQLRKLMIVCLMGIETLGAYKLAAAWMHHRSNVIFLIGMMFFAMIILPICAQHRRLSQRGKNFLRHLQSAFGKLRSVKDARSKPAEPDYAFGNASLPLMAMGLFGVSALQGSSYDPLYQSYQRAASTSGGCSTYTSFGCGSSSGDTGASCGSGSSCGSSCGGGGCGGCGGGGD
jgi:uncharacterized protein (TIGR04222 family)